MKEAAELKPVSISELMSFTIGEALTKLALQKTVVAVGTAAFGAASVEDRKERMLRFCEESAELQQALGLTFEEYVDMGAHVWKNPPGEPRQEFGGAGVTLMALANANGADLLQTIFVEIDRVASNIDAIRAKAAKKPDFLFAVRPVQ